jgi:type I restriction enzyme S subunit
MMNEWKKYKLGELVTLNYGKSLIAEKRIKGNIPVYSSAGFSGWHNASLVDSNGVIVGRKGNVGSVFYSKTPFFCIYTSYYILPDKSYDLKFIYYKLLSLNLIRLTSDSAVPGLNRETAYAQDISLPSLPTQRHIAQILTSFDDKIELLGQMNQTLETLAQAIFKEWFVNFNFPGFDGTLVEGLPKGWRRGKLGEVSDFVKGVSYKSSELVESTMALVTLKSINRFGGFNFNGFKEFNGKFKVSQELDNGDIVIAQTDITQAADVIGCPAIIENPFKYEKLIASLDLVKCIQKTDYFSKLVLYYFLSQKSFKDFCLSHTNGSTVLHLRSSEIPNYEFVIPDKFIIIQFSEIINRIRDKIVLNNNQVQSLTSLRDALLPKLMGGAVAV